MGLSIAIDDLHDMALITDAIHDRWFDPDRIVFHQQQSALEFPFTRRRWRADPPEVACCLRIDHVESYEIDDSERVGGYDFNKLVYDSEKREIRVLTGVPIDIRVKVKRLGVRVCDIE